MEVLEDMLSKLEPTDRKEKEMVVRALTALEPDGWRGVDHGLNDEASGGWVGVCGGKITQDVYTYFKHACNAHRHTYTNIQHSTHTGRSAYGASIYF